MASPSPVPRALVEKYGRKSFSLVSEGDALAGVGDFDLDRVARLRHGGGDVQFAHDAVLHALGGVIHQIGHHALDGLGIGHHWRQIGGQIEMELNAA